jgi:hypothetical protein
VAIDLLLQGRSARDRAKAFQVDGVDGEFRSPERDPDDFAFNRISGCSIAHRESQRIREGIELITGAASVTVLCFVCAYLASRTERDCGNLKLEVESHDRPGGVDGSEQPMSVSRLARVAGQKGSGDVGSG